MKFVLFTVLAFAGIAYADIPSVPESVSPDGKILSSIGYFGSPGSDARTLREHVRVSWRPDSKAFAITINDRFYSSSIVFALNKESKFVQVAFPSYETMTGFLQPDSKHLRPRGRASWGDGTNKAAQDVAGNPLPNRVNLRR